MKTVFLLLCCFFAQHAMSQKKYTGTFSNGYKGDQVSFVLSADGKSISAITFTGYWRCSGSLETITAGPDKKIAVNNGIFSGIITDPENGGASAFRFQVTGSVKGKLASGTFRMSITGLKCDTYVLKWEAACR